MKSPLSPMKALSRFGAGLLVFLCIIIFAPARAQYPYIIEMSQKMIGNATIVAKQEVDHKPGFWAKSGLVYTASIDPNFAGTGTAYEPPPAPGTQVVSPTNLNYVITTTPQVAGYVAGKSYDCSQVSTDIAYFDGLGRSLQGVSVMASPNQRDVIQPYTYDFAGRADSVFLPYESASGQNGAFDAGYSINQRNFINTLFGAVNKDYGFSQPFYESSPLGRVLKQSAPGADWAFKPNAPDQEHVAEMQYSSNETDISGWKVVNNAFTPITYSAGQLFVTVTKNENKGLNQSVKREYKDKEGKVVMVENQFETTWYRTRYIYDDFGLLRCVLPPKATSPTDKGAFYLSYFYTYDARHRMVCKKLRSV